MGGLSTRSSTSLAVQPLTHTRAGPHLSSAAAMEGHAGSALRSGKASQGGDT